MRSRLPLIIAAVLLAGLVTFVWSQDRENYRRQVRKEFGKLAQGLDRVPVVVTAKDVTKRGTVLTEAMIRVVKIPEIALQPYAVQDPADAIGKEPLGPLAQGQQLLRNQLVIPGTAGATLSSRIPPDKRAISIEITPLTSVSGFIRPNDNVDILWAFALPVGQEGPQPVILTLFQSVHVLAVGSRLRPPTSEEGAAEEAHTITLALTPQEIELLLFAQSQGALHFTLRPRGAGEEQLALPPVTRDAMLMKAVPELASSNAPPPPPPVAPAAPPKQIEVIRGKERQTVTVSSEGTVANSPPPSGSQMPQITPELIQSLAPMIQQQLGQLNAQPNAKKEPPGTK